MNLKSRSYGSVNQRKLVISRKIDIRNLVDELKSLGGVTEKYELVEPTDEKFISWTKCSVQEFNVYVLYINILSLSGVTLKMHHVRIYKLSGK